MSLRYLRKFRHGYIWKRLLYERLSEPLHMNLLSIPVALFGGFRAKVDWDLVLRHQHAYCLLAAADQAKRYGYQAISAFEFGVAAGAGLMNLQAISKSVTKATGVAIHLYGFDTGEGMPPPQSFKDHPELYGAGDFTMDRAALEARLEPTTRLVIGPISKTLRKFLAEGRLQDQPVGFVSVDVDYYSSTLDVLEILKGEAEWYLPRVLMYLDDLEDMSHNSRCGEMAAVNEFNAAIDNRVIERHAFLRGYRLFKNARWIDHIYQCHVLDHAVRNALERERELVVLENPLL